MQLKKQNCSFVGAVVLFVFVLHVFLISGCDGFKLRDKKTSSLSSEIGQNDEGDNHLDDKSKIVSESIKSQSLFSSSLLKKNALRDLLNKKKDFNARWSNHENDYDSNDNDENDDNDDDDITIDNDEDDDNDRSFDDDDDDDYNNDHDDDNDVDDDDDDNYDDEDNDADGSDDDNDGDDDNDDDDNDVDDDDDNEDEDDDNNDDDDNEDEDEKEILTDFDDDEDNVENDDKVDFEDKDDGDVKSFTETFKEIQEIEEEYEDTYKVKNKDKEPNKLTTDALEFDNETTNIQKTFTKNSQITEKTIKFIEREKTPSKLVEESNKNHVEKTAKSSIDKLYVFEKVNYPTIDTMANANKKHQNKISTKTKAQTLNYDEDEDEDEDEEDAKDNKKIKIKNVKDEDDETLTIFNLFGLFNQLKEADSKSNINTEIEENAETGLFDWLKKPKFLDKISEETVLKTKDKPNDVPTIMNLISSFNHKIINLFSFDDGTNDNDQDKKYNEKLIKGNKKLQSQPLDKDIDANVIQTISNNAGNVDGIDKKRVKKGTKTTLATDAFEERLLNLPSFVPNYTKVNNIDCKRQGQIFQRQLRGQKIWALEMMDASAKIPSGLMRGNINQLGDFDLCVDIAKRIKVTDSESIRMKGKYCLAHVDVMSNDDDLKLPVHLMQGKSFLRSTRNDPSHFFPRFTTLNWGICLPSACTHSDAERILRDSVKPYNATGLKIHIDIDPDNCYVHHKTDWQKLFNENWQICATLFYFAFIIILTVMASLNDYWTAWQITKQEKLENLNSKEIIKVKENTMVTDESNLLNQILMSFSIKRTGVALFNKPKIVNENENVYIDCINGIKGIGTILLYLSFKLISIARTPFNNRIYLTELFNSPWSIFLRTSFLFTDIFLLVSGILTGLAMSKDIKLRTSIPWIRRFIGRFIRIIPGLLAIVLFYAWIWEHLDTGPQWGDLIIKNSKLCKAHLWQNILNVQNFYNFDQICAPHTYQIAIDTQMYLIAPLIVWLLHAYPTYGLGAFGIIHAISAAMRYSTTINNRLSLIIFHGMKLSQLHRTANLSFLSPIHRATPFLTGLGLGVMIYQMGKNIKLPKGAIIIGWLSSLFGIILCFATQMNTVQRDYHYLPIVAAQYTAWSSLVWSIALSWIIFACHYGYGGFLNHILSTKLFLYLSKLTYSIFLLEFIIFFWSVASTSKTEYFQLSTYLNWTEILITIIAATIFTLLFDLPMQKIKSLLINYNYDKKMAVSANMVNENEILNNDSNCNAQTRKNNDLDEQEKQNEKMTVYNTNQNITINYDEAEEDVDYDEDEDEDENYNIQEEIDNDNAKNDNAEDDIDDIWAERKSSQHGISRALQSSPHYEDEEDEDAEEEENEEDDEVSEEKEVMRRPLAGSSSQTPSNLRRWRWIVHDD